MRANSTNGRYYSLVIATISSGSLDVVFDAIELRDDSAPQCGECGDDQRLPNRDCRGSVVQEAGEKGLHSHRLAGWSAFHYACEAPSGCSRRYPHSIGIIV
jgi:hypothetical protein